MPDFGFTEEQEIFRKSLREYLEKNISGVATEMFKDKSVSKEVYKTLTDFGLPGLKIPQEYGGAGADWITCVIAIEELARADLSGRSIIPLLLNFTEGYTLAKFGTDQLKEELLPKIVKGEAVLGVAATEPGCGTNVAAIKTTMKKDGDDYIVNGEKQYLSDVAEAVLLGGGHLVTGKTTPELGYKGMSVIYVPINSEGIKTLEFETIGLPLGGIVFENVRVPGHHLIGEENKGIYLTMESFVTTRIPVTMGMIGATKRVLEMGIDYLQQRKAFGRAIGSFEALQFQLAEDYAKWEAARWLTYRAAWMHEEMDKSGRFTSFEVSMAASEAKLVASMDCGKACIDVMNWHGATGTTTEFDVHMAVRNAFGMGMAEGTMEAQKLTIGMSLLGREYAPYR